MKHTIALLMMCCCMHAFGKNATFKKLCEVNKCWAAQKDVVPDRLPQHQTLSEHDWTKLHLSLVEQKLRERNTEKLSPSQKQNRALCLNYLHQYWQAGTFPINENYNYRTPIFIDKHNNFCAVGNLIKVTGNEPIARTISSKTNLAYVHEMKYPEIAEWAKQNGFTIDELAWIQPGYQPQAESIPIGKGVDGVVNELFADTSTGQLFVGGSFINADSAVVVNNIAYVTGSTGAYTWHSMGSGTNGPVNAITKYDGKIFAAGTFTTAGGNVVNNVAWWNGSTWHSTGCIAGTVQDLAVFNGDLYASGSFDVCSALHDVNFAKWNGTTWAAIPGLSGTINTMEVMDTMLLLGGAFTYSADIVNGNNVIRWNSTTSFQPFAGSINNEVKDFEWFQGAMYAVCKRTHPTDSTNLILKLGGNSWGLAYAIDNFQATTQPLSFNTLCAEPESLNMGGQFAYYPFIGTSAANCFNWKTTSFAPSGSWVNVNNTVNKMIIFNNDLIMGGAFTTGSNGNAPDVAVNGIVKRRMAAESVPALQNVNTSLNIFPVPAKSGAALNITNNINADHYNIRDINSRLFASGLLSNNQTQITFPSLAPGVYLLELSNNQGGRVAKQIEIR